ncbi:MAG: PDZ domain-containing protein [Gammaproteobacteria bacterium]|nr:PDZ domain-containing protein [Gammaproteobacteria bacterium]
MRIQNTPALMLALVLIIGLGIGWSISRNSVDNDVAEKIDAIATDDISLESLRLKVNELILIVENERQARQTLQRKYEQLQKQLIVASASVHPSNSATENSDASNQTSATGSDESTINAFQNDDRLNEVQQALMSLGMDTVAMEKIQHRVEQQEMQQLYLQNQARREGWYGTRRYFEETDKLESKGNVYREELGDRRYDKFLFQSGQNNRVKVQSVLSGSPAESIGLQENDIVYTYGDKRIFNWNDLTNATAAGDPQQMARVEVLRNGELIEFYIKRGPMGIRLGSARVDPEL